MEQTSSSTSTGAGRERHDERETSDSSWPFVKQLMKTDVNGNGYMILPGFYFQDTILCKMAAEDRQVLEMNTALKVEMVDVSTGKRYDMKLKKRKTHYLLSGNTKMVRDNNLHEGRKIGLRWVDGTLHFACLE